MYSTLRNECRARQTSGIASYLQTAIKWASEREGKSRTKPEVIPAFCFVPVLPSPKNDLGRLLLRSGCSAFHQIFRADIKIANLHDSLTSCRRSIHSYANCLVNIDSSLASAIVSCQLTPFHFGDGRNSIISHDHFTPWVIASYFRTKSVRHKLFHGVKQQGCLYRQSRCLCWR